MTDLETRLTQLGGDLDHPEHHDLIHRVRTRLHTESSATPSHEGRDRRIVVAIAVVAIVAIAVVTLTTRLTFDDAAHSTHPDAGSRSDAHRQIGKHTTPTTVAPPTIDEARSAVAFALRTPPNAQPTSITIDPTIPGGAVTLDYPGYRLFELAGPPGPVSARFPDGGALITATTVRGQSGYWITGNHDVIEYRGRNGPVRQHDAGPAGHVLMWSEDNATITITGATTLPAAMNIAATLA